MQLMFWIEFAMLPWLVICAEIMLALEDLNSDSWFYSRENQQLEAVWLMLSLGVSRCVGSIAKPMENT